MSKNAKVFLYVGAIAMVLLGVVRGAEGVILLVQGKIAHLNMQASDRIFARLALGLVVIGLIEVVCAFGLLSLRRMFFSVSIATTLVLVIDSAINEYFMFGQPGGTGALINLAAAIIIIVLLFLGRPALTGQPLPKAEAAPPETPSA